MHASTIFLWTGSPEIRIVRAARAIPKVLIANSGAPQPSVLVNSIFSSVSISISFLIAICSG